jgi:aspartyl-tRNA(Asn)/glutamyl-tRNA(Gln) amidotransferase subunit A
MNTSNTKEYRSWSIADIGKKLASKEISATEIATVALAAIEEDKGLNAVLGVFDDVLDQAKHADACIESGETSALTGIPVALKDNIFVAGKEVSAASKILKGYVASYDATVTKKLKSAGAVLVARTNMDEFAMGASTENSAFGVVKNPHDTTRVPGGSSGGSAALTASGAIVAALGSDTGGSIRQPAAFCGVVGFKPTYGRVSRYGLIAMGSSLDQIGSFGKTVSDAEILYQAIQGTDPLDSTTFHDETYTKRDTPQQFTIGVPRHFMEHGVDPDLMARFDSTLSELEKRGHKIVPIELPYIAHSLAVYYIVMPAEVSTNLSRFDGMRFGLHVEGDTLLQDYMKSRGEGFGVEPRRRILLGTYVLSSGYYDAYYGKANAVRRLVTADFDRAFEKVDVIATPTTPTPAFKIGEKSDPLSMYLADIFTVPANITGVPGISVPMGDVIRENKKLPVGIQFNAPHGNEHLLFAIGKEVEAVY